MKSFKGMRLLFLGLFLVFSFSGSTILKEMIVGNVVKSITGSNFIGDYVENKMIQNSTINKVKKNTESSGNSLDLNEERTINIFCYCPSKIIINSNGLFVSLMCGNKKRLIATYYDDPYYEFYLETNNKIIQGCYDKPQK